MDLSSRQIGRLPEAEYIPYFYESGQFLRYSGPVKSRPVQTYFISSGYDFTSEAKSSLDPDQPQTVEQIVAKGYFTMPTGDPVTAMITDKKHTSRLGLDDAIDQIRRRYEIYAQNIYELLLSQCYTINTFLKHYDRVRPAQPDDRIYYSLNKNMQKLYQQQRDERVNLWRDISRLKQALPESAQGYLTAYRKVLVLDDSTGGGP